MKEKTLELDYKGIIPKPYQGEGTYMDDSLRKLELSAEDNFIELARDELKALGRKLCNKMNIENILKSMRNKFNTDLSWISCFSVRSPCKDGVAAEVRDVYKDTTSVPFIAYNQASSPYDIFVNPRLRFQHELIHVIRFNIRRESPGVFEEALAKHLTPLPFGIRYRYYPLKQMFQNRKFIKKTKKRLEDSLGKRNGNYMLVRLTKDEMVELDISPKVPDFLKSKNTLKFKIMQERLGL